MNVGATEKEVQASKEQELPKPERYFTKRDLSNVYIPIYYYDAEGELRDSSRYPGEIYVPIENYSAMMIRQLDVL